LALIFGKERVFGFLDFLKTGFALWVLSVKVDVGFA
jgi:hypothetical protein